MRKLSLQVEALAVESFSTDEAQPSTGTVVGHGANSADSCNTLNESTCAQYWTCGGGGTCNGEHTCNRNCWPQEPQWYFDQDAQPTPCCTVRC